MLTAARLAEDLGFRGVFVFDHLSPIGDHRRPALEATCCLGAVMAVTTGLRVGPLVMRVGMRGAEVTAGVAATLAAIGRERAVLALGVGDRLSEDEAVRFGMEAGTSLGDRLEQLIQTIARVREIAPRLPIWVGGKHPEVRRLAAELADGWNAWDASPETIAEQASLLRDMAERPFTISWGGPLRMEGGVETAIRRLREVVATGVDEVIVSVLPNRPRWWHIFAERVWPKI
jgi:alkanesulfonate monooxygenase SsuD/methylene tetrahydromethanopterin reductase-like flavin-dependent oxidoreductase (luciferase family)